MNCMAIKNINFNKIALAGNVIIGIITLYALSFNSSECSAQSVSFGIHGSPNISWMKPDVKSIENDGVKLGFGYGLMLDRNFSDNYAFSTGLSVRSNTSKIKYNDTIPFVHDGIKGDSLPAGASVTYKLGYIEFPLTLKLKTNEIGYITYFGQFGLSSQFNIKAKGEATKTTTKGEGIDDSDISSEIKFLNLALKIGAGIQYSVGGNTYLTAAILYNNGFLDVTKDDEKVYLKSLALRLGVMF